MPTTPDRRRIEEALPPHVLQTIEDLCRLVRVDRREWHRVPGWVRVFMTLAALQLRDHLQEEGRTKEEAHGEAASMVGMSPATLRTSERRWFEDSYRNRISK